MTATPNHQPPTKPPPPTSRPLRSFVAGAAGGVVKTLFTLPLDVVKTTQQLDYQSQPRTVAGQANFIYSTRGIRGFFTGYDVALTQQIGKVGIQFASFEFWNGIVHQTFIAGCLAGITSACVWTTPTDRIKIVQQAELVEKSGKRRFHNSLQAIHVIAREQGPFGFFKGVLPTAIRDASSLGVRFFTYTKVKHLLSEQDSMQQSRVWHAPVAGGVCGVAGVLLNQPVDVAKTQMMSIDGGKKRVGGGGGGGGGGGRGSASTTTMIEILTFIIKNEGVSGLWRGLPARSLKIGVGQAVVFGVYGNIAALLGAGKVK